MIRKISIETPLSAEEQEIVMALQREGKMGGEGRGYEAGSLPVLKLEGRRR